MKQKETIEGSLRRLEEIVEQLGGETISLDDSLALFSEGMKLSQKCLQQLEEAELIVEQHSVSSSP
ncbi:MAG: exodeoxyribonuclease VII small subunit [Angelakisella sp.]|nr:exodeoxyribonuclease VII small subunit [Angelakisella sp.]